MPLHHQVLFINHIRPLAFLVRYFLVGWLRLPFRLPGTSSNLPVFISRKYRSRPPLLLTRPLERITPTSSSMKRKGVTRTLYVSRSLVSGE